MANIPYWYPNPHQFDDLTFESPANPWDVCSLNGVVLPGLSKVKVGKGRKLDVKQPPGSHGATITDQGYKPAPVEIIVTVWAYKHWVAMNGLFNGSNPSLNLEPKPNANYVAPTATIDHPATASRQVASIIIEHIDGPDDSSSVKGAKEYKFKCLQFFPPPKVNATNTPQGTVNPQPNALTPKDPSSNPIPAPS